MDNANSLQASLSDSFKAINLELRQELRDIYNRLHSIAEDADFIECHVRPAYPRYPVIANQRCGAWYVRPSEDSLHHSYFKSTDGHIGVHTFSIRRANLSLLPLISKRKGIVIVDSTRRGKRFPDALSKTIPIWCAVLNRARAVLRGDSVSDDGQLWTLSTVVGRSEHAQIEVKIEEWSTSLLASQQSSYDLAHLKMLSKPLRPIFVSPASSLAATAGADDELSYYPVVCTSASKLASDSDTRERGFAYAQGAGDDHETWSKGLTPDLFWRHSIPILAASRQDVETVIAQVLLHSDPSHSLSESSGRIRSTLLTLTFAPPSSPSSTTSSSVIAPLHRQIFISASLSLSPTATTLVEVAGSIRIEAKSGKLGHTAYFKQLWQAIDSAEKAIRDEGVMVEVVVNESESQNEANDLGVALALAILLRCYDDNAQISDTRTIPTKTIIRERTNWILEVFPKLNPSRSILNRVNEYLIGGSRMSGHVK